jgi:broad specificity phosphatase PhoE
VTTIVLVRHGEAAAAWGDDADPGLSDLGRAQAAAVAAHLGREPRRPIITSPLRRCRETAATLGAAWRQSPSIQPRVGEIESNDHDLDTRADWLRDVLSRRWSEVDPSSRAWRDDVVSYLLSLEADTIVFTHFVAINVAIGQATGDERIVCRRAGNCSQTVLQSDGVRLSLVSEPAEPDRTEVL